MITIENVRDFPGRHRGGYLTIGNFDGVHQGHQNLIAQLRARAATANVPALAITFDPHPVALLRPEKAPVPLVWPEREVQLLKASGVDEVCVFRTGPWLLNLSAREFFDQVVVDLLDARGLVEGPNFAFGRDRQGDVNVLASWCHKAGIDFKVVEPTLVDDQLVSSSRIRLLLSEGRVEEANSLLTRPHRIRGIVTHGAARGRGLGFPTANLDGIDTLIPLDGVYAARAWILGEERTYAVACNIGPNPTFGEQIRKVEAHLIGFDGDLYDRRVDLDILGRLRGTRRFEGLDDLLAQIRLDINRAASLEAEYPAPAQNETVSIHESSSRTERIAG